MTKNKNGTRIHVGDIWYAKIGDSILLEEIRLDEITEFTVCFTLRINDATAFRQRASATAWSPPKRYTIADMKFIELKSRRGD